MKQLFVGLLLILSASLFSQNKLTTTVYLNNGDIIKGDIVKEVQDELVIIKTANGSRITISYKDITKMTKERITPDSFKSAEKNNSRFNFGVKAGFFNLDDDNLGGTYGNSYFFGGMLDYNTRLMKIRLDVDYYSSDKVGHIVIEPVSRSESSIAIVPVTISVLRQFDLVSMKPFIGVGLGVYYLAQKYETKYMDGEISTENKIRGSLGFLVTCGTEIPLAHNLNITLGLKYSYSRLAADSFNSQDYNLGGFKIFCALEI